MGRWDVRLLAATYRRVENDQLSVEMYGTLDDGRSITVRYVGFEPYFDVVEPTAAALEQLRKDPDVRRVEDISLFYKGKLRQSAKVYVRFPWLVPDFRARLRREFEVLAADIPFHHRFLYDFDVHACIRVYGKEGVGEQRTDLIVDMERTEGNAPHFENLPPFNPDLKVLSFDIENAIKDGTILTICYVIREGGVLRGGPPISGDERTIIDEFTRVVQEEDPDVITGYNIDNYDIPTLMERAKVCKAGKLAWGRDLSEPRKVGLRGWRLTGRLVVDAWWAAKMQLRPKQETLNHVAKLCLGEEKLDVEPSKMDEEWERDRHKVMRYCLKDAELALRVLEYVGSLRRTMDLAAVSMLPMDDVQSSGNSTLIDSILIREADRVPPPFGPVGVPLTGNFDDEEDAIEGGYVHTIEPGLYHWVVVLDFKSMYPSLIISKNICFTTLSEEGTNVSPTGIKFLSKDIREGLLPKILKDLMAQRDDIKKKMKVTQDADELRYYDGLQNAVKILMNAVYGVFASSFYRFTDRNIGSAITAYARETVKTLINRLEGDGNKVIYGDSITADRFVTLLDPEGTVRIKNIEELFNEHQDNVRERGQKEVIVLQGYKALSMLPSGKSTWSDIKEIIRHRTDKRIYRVGQKFGESVTTEDHSFITWQDGRLTETKPRDMLYRSMIRVEEIPPVKKVETLDMYELLRHRSYGTTCGSSVNGPDLESNDEHVWLSRTERMMPVKLKRFIETGSPELEALCRLLGKHIAKGSGSTVEAAIGNEAEEQQEEDYRLLFKGARTSTIGSASGTGGPTYGGARSTMAFLYEDHTPKQQMMDQMVAVLFRGLCGQMGEGERLPDFMFHLEDQYKRVLLDNIIVKGSYETSSLHLACGISLLLNQLNERYTMECLEGERTYRITQTHDNFDGVLSGSIREEEYDGYVYDLSVEGTHAFVDSCGQVLLHNTDSLFVQSPHHDLEGTVAFGKEISERFSREISQMEFQKVLEPLFSHGKKKRYVGRSVWPDQELLVRGYETRRTDAFDLQSGVLMSVFEKILDGQTDEAVRIARENVQLAMDCKVPVESLVISRTCKSFNSYKDPDSQANVQAARKLMAMGYDFIPGMKVSWIVTDSRKTPQEVEPYVSGRKFEHRPDCRYYAERVAQTAARATEVFGWGEKDLLTGSQQVTLFDSSFAGGSDTGRKKKEPEVKRPKKKLDLRDFM